MILKKISSFLVLLIFGVFLILSLQKSRAQTTGDFCGYGGPGVNAPSGGKCCGASCTETSPQYWQCSGGTWNSAGCGNKVGGGGGGGGQFNCQAYGKPSNGSITSITTNADNSVTIGIGLEYGGAQGRFWDLIWGTDYNAIVSNTGDSTPGFARCNGSPSNGCLDVSNPPASYRTPPLDPHVMYFFGLQANDTLTGSWCGFTGLFPYLNKCDTTPNPITMNTGTTQTFTTDAYHSSLSVLPYLTPITSVQYQGASCRTCNAQLFVYYSAPTPQIPTYYVVTYFGSPIFSGVLPTSYNGYYITIQVPQGSYSNNAGLGGYTYFIPPTYPNYVQSVGYTGNPAFVSINPASDPTSAYQTVVRALVATFPATVQLYTTVNAIGQVACTSITPVTIKQGATATIVLTPPTAIVPLGGTQALLATVSKVVGGVVSSVTFTSSNPAVATVAPASDTTSPYNATVTAKAKGSATITASVIIGGVAVASATSVITVPAASATIVLTPPTATVPIGGTQVLTGTVSNIVGGVVSSVTFTSSKPTVATVAPASDTTSPYNATVTGVAVGSATITANVIIGGIVAGSATSVITVPASSCTVTMSPASATIPVGSSGTYTATVTPVGGTVDQVNFTSSNTSFATVAPASDTTVSYTTQATGVNLGTTTIRADVIMGGVLKCSVNTSTVTVVPASPWWQVKDSDLSSNGDLTSIIPPVAGTLFDLVGPGGFPGIPSYAGSTSLTGANVSSTGWLANSTTVGQKTYDYSYFANQIPASTTINTINSNSIPGSTLSSGGTLDGKTGYYWYKYDGSGSGLDLTLTSASDMGGRKVVLLVSSASFNINFPINVTDGAGFFMVIVGKNSGGAKGNITVSTAVGGGAGPNLEGLYLADGTFSDGAGATRLSVRGSVVANSANLQRNLGGAANLNPSELFEYAPDQTLLFPSIFGARRINWKEVAP
jgi:uncharacterized protein YjdB